MTKKLKRVRVVEVVINKSLSTGKWWWEAVNIGARVFQIDYCTTRHAAIADARRWWAQFGVTVKVRKS